MFEIFKIKSINTPNAKSHFILCGQLLVNHDSLSPSCELILWTSPHMHNFTKVIEYIFCANSKLSFHCNILLAVPSFHPFHQSTA